MSTDLIPFESAALPAHLAQMGTTDDLSSGGGGFPIISIKGKVFHLKRGDELTLITKPGEDDPAASLELVILKAYPEAGKTAKAYYGKGYVEGSVDSPICASNDGVAPLSDSAEPQSATCATCPQAVWGSKITEDGKKVKACADMKRLAVAAVDQLNDPMLLRVPAASLKALTAFSDVLAKRGVPYQGVLTKIGFDYSVAHPALTFKPVGFIGETSVAEVLEMRASPLVRKITGEDFVARTPRDEKPAPTAAAVAKAAEPAPAKSAAPAKPAAAKPAAKAAPKPTAKPPADDLPTTPKATVKVASEGSTVEAGGGMENLLSTLDFDD